MDILEMIKAFAPYGTAFVAIAVAIGAWLKRSGAHESERVTLRADIERLASEITNLLKCFAAIEVKVDTMWDFVLRRAKSEAVSQGIATMNSPLIFTPLAHEIIAPVAKQIRDWYLSLDRDVSDAELALLIEQQFGDKLLQDVCIPNNLYMGACLWIAIEVARDTLIVNTGRDASKFRLIVEAASDRQELHDRLDRVETEQRRQDVEQRRQGIEQDRQGVEQQRQEKFYRPNGREEN